jgi:hypothetical protein
VAGVVVVLLAGTCGVQPDDHPRDLAADEVPYGLLDEGPPIADPTPTTAPSIEQVNVAVYFLNGERLHPAPRAVTDPPIAGRVLSQLIAGPTDDEAVTGLRSAINPLTQVSVSRPSPEILVVDLTPEFAAVPISEQRLALAQIVYTATGLEGVQGVRFTVGGSPVAVPLPDGTVTSEPVRRDSFAALAPDTAPGPNPA